MIATAEMRSRTRPIVAVLLVLLALAPFFAEGGLDAFIAFDDDVFVYENPAVVNGLSVSGIRWALSSLRVSSWHPLTWIAHMTVVSLFGLDPWWHHAVNVLIHAATTALLFTALRRLTGQLWRSALVAALFAVHPLHVESVAWVSELKDLLSGLFFAAGLLAYERYVRRGGTGRLLSVLLLLALGLLAKPMLVTFPLVLLLCDGWPLGRARATAGSPGWGGATGWFRLLREKAPLLLLSAASSAATVNAGLSGGAISSFGELPLGARIANALAAHAFYLVRTVWPHDLAIYYPHPGFHPWWKTAGAALLLSAATAAAVRLAPRRPYALAGWLWFLVMLVPVAGIVQSGAYAMADRYTYLPLIGIFIAVAWGLADAGSRRRIATLPLAAGALAAVAALAVLSGFQVQRWRDSETLFTHALAVTEDNWMIRNNLGAFYESTGRLAEAEASYREALRINPLFVNASVNLASVLAKRGREEEALDLLAMALRRAPEDPRAHFNAAVILAARGRIDEAVAHYREAVRLRPEFVEARTNLALLLAAQGARAEAEALHREAVRLRPDLPEGHYHLGDFLAAGGRLDEAQAKFAESVRLRPGDAASRFSLGAVLAAQGRLSEADEQFQQALRVDPAHEGARKGLALVRAQQAGSGHPRGR